ncbi:MAG: type II secretion system F family protein [Azonexus sp.]|jgi:tight adherence protein B|nr:type II secretion system F family protein [Erythrobacter sp.]MDZ4313369.1 type II secretion system F family protein [Azonexus sp.]PKP64579.1 MAG: secretion system protein [Alphaproteobacteria bacterium HGW-Alphaproteobacteria-7]
MTDAFLRLGILLALFATTFIVVQAVLNVAWARRSRLNTINQRLKLISEGRSRDEIISVLRKNTGSDFSAFPQPLASLLAALERSLRAAGVPFATSLVVFAMAVAFGLLVAVIGIAAAMSGFTMSAGTVLLIVTLSFCAAVLLPVLVVNALAQRRRKRMEEQFPISLDVFIRALRAGHPVASAIDLLTREMPDPIGSEYGLVADEVSYGAELADSLSSMAERWGLEDIRMFVVSLSVQNETGGNLAEILENLASVIRARASLFLKVRALSSEGRMTGWILTILPVGAFVVLFAVNPAFYLDVADDPAFIIGFVGLIVMYAIGFATIRMMINIKV